MSELRAFVIRHADLIAHYHTGYVAGYDAPLLTELMKQSSIGSDQKMSDYEHELLNACVQALYNVKGILIIRNVRHRLDDLIYLSHICLLEYIAKIFCVF